MSLSEIRKSLQQAREKRVDRALAAQDTRRNTQALTLEITGTDAATGLATASTDQQTTLTLAQRSSSTGQLASVTRSPGNPRAILPNSGGGSPTTPQAPTAFPVGITQIALQSLSTAFSTVFEIQGSPITALQGSGSFQLDFTVEPPNFLLAGPLSGAQQKPTFRLLKGNDLLSALLAGTGITLSIDSATNKLKIDSSGGGAAGGGGGGLYLYADRFDAITLDSGWAFNTAGNNAFAATTSCPYALSGGYLIFQPNDSTPVWHLLARSAPSDAFEVETEFSNWKNPLPTGGSALAALFVGGSGSNQAAYIYAFADSVSPKVNIAWQNGASEITIALNILITAYKTIKFKIVYTDGSFFFYLGTNGADYTLSGTVAGASWSPSFVALGTYGSSDKYFNWFAIK
jgi:hypothetical protein